jgi:hypothetical protein
VGPGLCVCHRTVLNSHGGPFLPRSRSSTLSWRRTRDLSRVWMPLALLTGSLQRLCCRPLPPRVASCPLTPCSKHQLRPAGRGAAVTQAPQARHFQGVLRSHHVGARAPRDFPGLGLGLCWALRFTRLLLRPGWGRLLPYSTARIAHSSGAYFWSGCFWLGRVTKRAAHQEACVCLPGLGARAAAMSCLLVSEGGHGVGSAALALGADCAAAQWLWRHGCGDGMWCAAVPAVSSAHRTHPIPT